ncbi:MAG TPA: metallophosphoesterase [Opitutaceae bacterium]|nr:metallophosphoesterase [Opitutaceae bacterium]
MHSVRPLQLWVCRLPHIGFVVSTLALISTAFAVGDTTQPNASLGEFIFTSDVHYGIARGNFRGGVNVESQSVNAAMVRKINRLPSAVLPKDDGLKAGVEVGGINFLVITGDITNRQELYPLPIQSSSISWGQFEKGFLNGITLKGPTGQPTPLFLVPGNHDVSDAIGSPSKMNPLTDATSMAEMYNRMVKSSTPRTKDTYNYATDKVYYAKDVAGAHCIFLTIWPETRARTWMEADLKNVPTTTPVFIFAHDPPDVDPKHLTNPNGDHGINSKDRFENILADVCADGSNTGVETTIEQRAFVAFLKAHKNIVAYFHGHSNWTEYYPWKGPDNDIALNTFRSDSPMKGKISGKDEIKLAFQFVIFDTASKKMTVRECLWNSPPSDNENGAAVAWGKSITVSLAPRI